MPTHHKLEQFLDEYRAAAGIVDHDKTPLPLSRRGKGSQVRIRLSGGGSRIRTCMGLFVSSGCFWFVAVLCSEREGRSSFFNRAPGVKKVIHFGLRKTVSSTLGHAIGEMLFLRFG
jgi:hypothetical protein